MADNSSGKQRSSIPDATPTETGKNELPTTSSSQTPSSTSDSLPRSSDSQIEVPATISDENEESTQDKPMEQIPENWWDMLPDFDPRVYDAILMEQAAACVSCIFQNLPDMHELENSMTARAFPRICSRMKTQVQKTIVQMPSEVKYETKIG